MVFDQPCRDIAMAFDFLYMQELPFGCSRFLFVVARGQRKEHGGNQGQEQYIAQTGSHSLASGKI
jgi:hypothetical protein